MEPQTCHPPASSAACWAPHGRVVPLPPPRRACAAGGIRLWPSPSTTDDFLGLQFSNLRRPLRGVALNGVKMQPTDYGGQGEGERQGGGGGGEG